ncbi:hypothetical protein ACIHFD_62135 [Nonomuraea sp. NPDC051941]|uniref:hypothetical protein n=1 Tax=Nonomuraea sp. NPDC051941 TaxID=3364373 RepID=UPI0037CA9156
MTPLSRLFDVRPEHRHPVRVQRDLEIPAADGVRLRRLPAMATAARELRRATLTLPLNEADLAPTGHGVPWFREWIEHGPDDPIAAHPRFGRNPGTGEPPAEARELRSSSHEIFHDPEHPSAIWLPVFSGAS